ncbi:MAG: bifunctional adenosylcobinamide kinase/adenosylcobinamide-phosphate guanylyltransferase [Alphaproteobacteria bacterium]
MMLSENTPFPAKFHHKSLILGGVRSGKSLYAEQCALKWHESDPKARRLFYLATASVDSHSADSADDGMKARIAAHQKRRGQQWKTLECPDNLPKIIRNFDQHDALLMIDCLSLYLNNLLMLETDISAQLDDLVDAVKNCPHPMIMVSSEVNMGLLSEYKLGRDFQDHIGTLHQKIAILSDHLILMVAGYPLFVKGA